MKSPADSGKTAIIVPTLLPCLDREMARVSPEEGEPTEAPTDRLSEEREWWDLKKPHVKVWCGETKNPIGTDLLHEVFENFETMA